MLAVVLQALLWMVVTVVPALPDVSEKSTDKEASPSCADEDTTACAV